MTIVLLDTTVASLLHPKAKGRPLSQLYEPEMRGRILALSFQSVGELWLWAEQNRWGQTQRDALHAFLRRFVVIPYDYNLAQEWAKVMAHCKARGDDWKRATRGLRQRPFTEPSPS
jgi:tRNA(fMet)-specific endonuclease VapC